MEKKIILKSVSHPSLVSSDGISGRFLVAFERVLQATQFITMDTM